jgi:hypothetical protein
LFAGCHDQQAYNRLLQCVLETLTAKHMFGSAQLWQLPGCKHICSSAAEFVSHLASEHVASELQQLLPQWGAAAATAAAGAGAVAGTAVNQAAAAASAAELPADIQSLQNLATVQLERAAEWSNASARRSSSIAWPDYEARQQQEELYIIGAILGGWEQSQQQYLQQVLMQQIKSYLVEVLPVSLWVPGC